MSDKFPKGRKTANKKTPSLFPLDITLYLKEVGLDTFSMSLITLLCFIYHWLIVNWDTSAILVICRKLKTGNDIIYNLSPSLRIKRYIHLSTFLHGSKEYETNTLIHTFYIVSTTFYRINTHACTNNLQPLKHSTFQGTVWNKGWVNGKWCTNVERD